ncbi:hypothetical protein [Legionella tucsonensis]|uniref:Uncharacterized protein n=1 Tax=Legionella tucsonensis TaxID=40335 RepID=A0A0W0ZXZ0_9GAMM|nr:hypothetical protein [Legionella tucsonensis]KTD73972.1 hypothetical protein Ltuc_1819 [Legionella tucsonensis]
MAYTKIDQPFLEAFTSEFILHLSKPYDPHEENGAQEMIAQASFGDFGKISRIFDQLARLPCISREEFNNRMAETKSIEVYMKPIIDKVAELLLTPDKSRLNDKVIKAIGVDNYCRLVNGKNVSQEKDKIEIVANIDESAGQKANNKAQEKFVKTERNLAKSFLEAILPCYSACIYENNVLPEERTRHLLENQIRELKSKIQSIDETKKGIFPTGWEEPNLVSEKISLKEFDKQGKELVIEIRAVLQDESSNIERIWELLKKCDALVTRGTALLLESNAELGKMTDPIQQLGLRLAKNNGSIFDLKEEPRKPDYFTLKNKVDALLEIIRLSKSKLTNSELSGAMNELEKKLEEAESQLNTFHNEFAEQLKDRLPIPDQAIEPALEPYTKGISTFLEAIDQTKMKDLKPYEMSVVQRIINVISFGYFFAEERIHENSSLHMKSELMKMKSELDNPMSEAAVYSYS